MLCAKLYLRELLMKNQVISERIVGIDIAEIHPSRREIYLYFRGYVYTLREQATWPAAYESNRQGSTRSGKPRVGQSYRARTDGNHAYGRGNSKVCTQTNGMRRARHLSSTTRIPMSCLLLGTTRCWTPTNGARRARQHPESQ